MSEELRHLIPKNKVIYKLPNCDGYYGFTDNGTRVADIMLESCCEDVIMKTYLERGVDTYFTRWFYDIVDAFPEEFNAIGDDIGRYPFLSGFIHAHSDKFYELRNRYLFDYIGFIIQPDPKYFDLDVTGVDEVKSAIKQSLKKGVAVYDLRDYISYLRDSGKITSQEYSELNDWIMGDNYFKLRKYQEKVAEAYNSDDEEEEEDIMSSTKITADTSVGTPKNPVIYKCIDWCYEGYTNNGNKVEDDDWEYCGRDIVIQNYEESGMDYNDAFSRFWLDVRECYPDEFDRICSLYGKVDLEHLATDSVFDDVLTGSDDLHELCYSYLHHIGFRTELDPEQFPMDITSESELKDILRGLMLAGAEEDILDEYIKRLHYVNHVLDWGEYTSISTWLGQKFNTRSFGNKISDIAREMYDDEEEDDIMSATRITASYDFNYDLSGEDDVKAEVRKALQHTRYYNDLGNRCFDGTELQDIYKYLDELCYDRGQLTLDEYDDIITYIRRFYRKWYQDKYKQFEDEEDSVEEEDILGSTNIYATIFVSDVKTKIRKMLLNGADYFEVNRYLHGLRDSGELNETEIATIRMWLDYYGIKFLSMSENSAEDEDDIMSATTITASTNSVGTPNDPVIYEKAGQQGFYGYSNGGKKVTAPSWDRCAMNIVLQNYMESGMSEEDARYQFWQDVKDFNPEAMIERCGGDLDVRSEEFEYIRSEGLLNELRFEYLVNGLDFYDVLDQNIFDYRVSNIDEVKHLLKKAMLAGATPNQYYDYFSYLLNSSIITQNEYDELCDLIDTKFADSGFRIKNYARVYENSGDEDEEDIMNSIKIKESKIMGRKFTKKPRYFANMVSADTAMSDERYIILIDGDGMDGYAMIFKTNAPKSRLKALEQECKNYDSADMPIWRDVLEGEGYSFVYTDECIHVTPYGTSEEWLEDNYPDVTETYYIDCD